jgi:predicted transcriptional regulator
MGTSGIDLVFAALAHLLRRRMIDPIIQMAGMSVSALSSIFDFSRIAVTKRVATLEQASPVLSKRKGRKRQLFFNGIPIQ